MLAHESIDVSAYHGGPAVLEQVLGRKDGVLTLFTREQAPTSETLTKTILPEPLDREPAMGSGTIRQYRPEPCSTFALHIQPRKPDGIVHIESKRTSQGWKDTTTRGVPIYVYFESSERAPLEALRVKLYGQQLTRQVEHFESQQEEFERRWSALPPEEQHTAFMHQFLQMVDMLDINTPPPGDVPADLQEAVRHIQGRLQDAQRQAREEVAKNPVDPELKRLMDEVLRSTLGDRQDEEE
jgi:hypothetical protein